ncbi:MAG TPA: threonylcarbamoyl-AMP synthase [Clostridiaceae bacterium]|nr:threonylcarbamoyl-AMP synthase [Clostridiaceae bacterium]
MAIQTQVIDATALLNARSEIEKSRQAKELLAVPASALAAGKVVAFPTETVYGLGANIHCPEAVDQIFTLKGRPNDNPLIVHVGQKEAIFPLVSDYPKAAEVLVQDLMPGPLTLVLPRSKIVPDNVTAGLDTVGIRLPNHDVTRYLLKLAAVPVAAPSANLSGKPSPTLAEHVVHDLKGALKYVVDGGPCKVGVESTVLDLSAGPPLILRPGGVTAATILTCLVGHGITFSQPNWQQQLLQSGTGHSVVDADVPKSPGMKYRHYAPEGTVKLIAGSNVRTCTADVLQKVETLGNKHSVYGIFANQELISDVRQQWPSEKQLIAYSYGPNADINLATHELFAGLRFLDERKAEFILVETFPDRGMGTAYMNRLIKAAGGTPLEIE